VALRSKERTIFATRCPPGGGLSYAWAGPNGVAVRAAANDRQRRSAGIERVIENGKIGRPRLSGVKTRIAIASAKGGAGKSALTVNLAAQLALQGHKVGIFDADFEAPSVATMLGLMPGILIPTNGLFEPAAGPLGLRIAGLDLIADPLIPLVSQDQQSLLDSTPSGNGMGVPAALPFSATAGQLLDGLAFGDLDMLFIDLATGLTALREIADIVQLSAVLVVTQSAPSALRATRILIEGSRSLDVPVLAIVENMTAFYCSQCRSVRPLLPQGPVLDLARAVKLPLLARLPFDPRLAESCEGGAPFVQRFPETPLAKQLADLARKIKTAADVTRSQEPLPNGRLTTPAAH